MRKFAIAALLVTVSAMLFGFDGCNIDLSRTNGNQKVDDTEQSE